MNKNSFGSVFRVSKDAYRKVLYQMDILPASTRHTWTVLEVYKGAAQVGDTQTRLKIDRSPRSGVVRPPEERMAMWLHLSPYNH